MNWHLFWLWLWFLVGMSTYWLKRAYYLVTGPNPIATTYGQFIQRCWIPLLVRMFLDSLVFWALFTPGFTDKALTYLGWTNFAWVVGMITQFAVFAATFGHTVDSVLDFAIGKIPWVKDVLPQMPGPLTAVVTVKETTSEVSPTPTGGLKQTVTTTEIKGQTSTETEEKKP